MSCGEPNQHGKFGTPEYEPQSLEEFSRIANNRGTEVEVAERGVYLKNLRHDGFNFGIDRPSKLPHPNYFRLRKVILIYDEITEEEDDL